MVYSTICRRLPVLFLIFCSLATLQGAAQDTDRLSPEFHVGRRSALRNLMPAGSVVVIFSNPVRNRSNSVDYQYSQNPGFYYLTGYIEPDAALFLFRDSVNLNGRFTNEILLIEGPNKASATWSGQVLTTEETNDSLKINSVFLNRDCKKVAEVLCEKTVWIIRPDQPRKASYSESGLPALVQAIESQLRKCQVVPDTTSLTTALAQLREVKQPEELLLLRKAIDLTVSGFQKMIKAIEPGMKEYQAQAIIEYETKMGGSEYQGYPSISGAGLNACVLHYTFNRSKLESGDLLLADMGAEYHGYTADITRTVPVNGKFSPAQLQLYQLVLKAQNAGIAECVPGKPFSASHFAARKVIAEGLLDLGITASESEVSEYFMHGTSHYLGLDVHDPGTKGPLKAGTVMTVEPGIYIRKGAACDPKWWDIGIRIEDDILVTDDDGPVNLSGKLVRDPAAIEKMMWKGTPKK
jgi:Xaa-Pro aminopeptidase